MKRWGVRRATEVGEPFQPGGDLGRQSGEHPGQHVMTHIAMRAGRSAGRSWSWSIPTVHWHGRTGRYPSCRYGPAPTVRSRLRCDACPVQGGLWPTGTTCGSYTDAPDELAAPCRVRARRNGRPKITGLLESRRSLAFARLYGQHQGGLSCRLSSRLQPQRATGPRPTCTPPDLLARRHRRLEGHAGGGALYGHISAMLYRFRQGTVIEGLDDRDRQLDPRTRPVAPGTDPDWRRPRP